MTKKQVETAKKMLNRFSDKELVSRAEVVDWCEEEEINHPQWFFTKKFQHSRGLYSIKKLEQKISGEKIESVEAKPNKFTITKRFEMMEQIITMVMNGHQKSMVIVGRGGTGKTTAVVNALSNEGYVSGEWGSSDPKSYVHIKGTTSPTELYKTLYENRSGLIVFDDCDSVFKNDTTVNILKAVLDTAGKREVSWISPYIERQEIPTTFEFFGRVIFISNWKMEQIPQAVQSRAMLLDLDFTDEELIQRMLDIGGDILNVSQDIVQEIVDWINENKNSIKDVSIRTLLKVGNFRKHNPGNWRELCEFAV